jgi:hypothetical protein
VRHTEGYYIGPHPAQSDNHGTFANANELPHRDATSENDVIANGYVSGKQNVVGEDHMIANLAVMSHVGTDHEKAMVTDFRDTATVLSADAHRHVLTNVAIAADHQSCRPATIA